MAGDRNRPVNLLMERKKKKKKKKKMMMMMMMFFQPNGIHKCTSFLVPISRTSE
jgi:DNA polymerase III delta prime subunit